MRRVKQNRFWDVPILGQAESHVISGVQAKRDLEECSQRLQAENRRLGNLPEVSLEAGASGASTAFAVAAEGNAWQVRHAEHAEFAIKVGQNN